MSIQDIQQIGEIQRLVLKPGDRVVLSTSRQLSHEMVERIREVWAAFAPDLTPLMVLDCGMSLSVLSKDDS